jgi:hypothetical protein
MVLQDDPELLLKAVVLYQDEKVWFAAQQSGFEIIRQILA